DHAHDHDHDHDHDHEAGPTTTSTGAATATTATSTEKDDHDHGEHDPHVWHDVRYAMIMVGNVHDALVAADPDGARTYTANRDRYLAELEVLDREIETAIRGLADRRFVTNHEALAYYADRYGLDAIGSIIPSFDSSAELSAADVSRLVSTLKDNDVRVIFAEQSLPARTAEVIAREAGCRIVSGEDALYSDALGPAGSPGATYVGMMRHNTRVIVEALSGVGTGAR
ncbi:MAG: zinc ABC transporter substrate-binding protein, partial [Actinobacteria bacterium]|nr:zinc ABC transporter substrate-binding protein [Actinomycetota bacterium]